jgi:hypothetical protein
MLVRNIVLDPDKFYRQSDMSLFQAGVIIILLTGVVRALIGGTAMYTTATNQIPDIAIGVLIAVGGVKMIFTTVISWLVTSVIFYLLSKFVDANGNFRTVAMYVSWGYAPQMLESLYGFGRLLITINTGGLPSSPQFDPLTAILSILAVVWSVYLWIFAIKHARDISYKQAVSIVVPVGGLLILPEIYSLPVW